MTGLERHLLELREPALRPDAEDSHLGLGIIPC